MKVNVAQLCLTLYDPMDYTIHGISQARILERVAPPFSRKKIPWRSKGSSQPRDRTQVSTMQVDSLPAEPQGKPKNTGVGSLSLLQRIFLTQESNWGLLHCRQILYQLSYEGSQESLLAQNKSTSTWENMNLNGIGRYTQLCWTIWDPMDCNPQGSSVHGIFQARILEWAAISFSRGSSWPRARTWVSCTAGRFFTD